MSVLRGVATLGYFVLGTPPAALMMRLRDEDRSAARARSERLMARARRIAGITFDVSGVEHVPKRGGYVVAYNETSLADLLVATQALWPHTDRTIIAAEFGMIPFMREAAKRTGLVLLERGDRAVTDAALRELAEFARGGGRVSFAAQGGVSKEPGVPHFKRGAFLVAIRAGVPVVPMAVRGGREVLAPGSLRMRPGRIRCRFGEPIAPAIKDEDAAPELAERVRRIVAAMHDAMPAR